METSKADPKGLVRESYRIDGISAAECRSIFLDWALSLPADTDQSAALRSLIVQYGENTAHPMTEVLHAGLQEGAIPRRRGGRAGRLGS